MQKSTIQIERKTVLFLLIIPTTYKMQFGRLFTFSVVLFGYFMFLASGAALLPVKEVDALKEIAKTLRKTNWNFSEDPCGGGESSWKTLQPEKGFQNAVTCNCSYANNTICHVISIILRAQSLPGILPPELVKLPYLQEIDLTHNYLNGTIPKEWGSMQLVNISLVGNRLSGVLPIELANITTLKIFQLDVNNVSGVIPPEFGSMVSIERFLLSSNNFTGPLPETLAKLTTLKDFRISDNHFTGKIPDFIQNWTNLDKIRIQASGLEGPIPLGISLWTKISDLRISDLKGREASFPPLSNMTKLKILDISFNKLIGEIPSSFNNMKKAKFIYLTGNALTGPVPESMVTSKCNISGVFPCLKSFPCPKKNSYSFHINSGGEVVADGNTKFEEDKNYGGPSNFFLSSTHKWAFSSTGNFMDDHDDTDSYTFTNTSELKMKDYQLYANARISPLSLTYYGFCLGNGNYTVSLHFAEIIFTNDNTYRSLGRRIFDIFIQGKLVLKDFNIEDEAGGVGKAVIKNFTAVVTGNNTLEIRFYWNGKGTTRIPLKGTYGPLVSAISVTSDFNPPLEDGKKISPGLVVGIVLSVSSLIVIVLGILWCKGCFGWKNEINEDLRGLDIQTGSFTLRQIKAATNNFDADNKIGEGGFGPVYKGLLSDGTIIAVKQLSSKSKQGNREFVNEIGMISALQHPNLVRLYGCCIEGNQLLLVYEYMENNSLARALFGKFSFVWGYMAPEYAMSGYLTAKADVYSFGVVALEIALVLQEKGELMDLVDPRLESNYIKEEVLGMINVALLCTNSSPTLRPMMSSVVSMLEGQTAVQKVASGSGISSDDMKFKAIRNQYQQILDPSMNDSQTQSMSMEAPWTVSSTSASDLYPINPDSQYWKDRE
ncbi:hypothetical protein IFM89_005242 [Coptis chinensis]|uniref:non-specific serine/threonine protein kinase n=1 Tax=Coptis chinensis TaxID=261450 RepID=A0A835H1T5_9MAGN|nr:hypothetical protein IFM89_005242 [Coptis chinensis]